MYLSRDPKSLSYEHKSLSSVSIMLEVQRYCSVFKDEPFSKFLRWCTVQKLAFLDTAVKRKYKALPTKSSLRGIYVLKDCFKVITDVLLEEIASLSERCKQYISKLTAVYVDTVDSDRGMTLRLLPKVENNGEQ
ncbi:hypothetical protein BDF20DRAFT_840629 [Mycotypha africana]|uniref:uncharacterized protein n=1 Tax=Mycotypha africana TaxID=64632 RepID=UPI0023004E19|nr:uncharacterized protein BDF20DRAFT_840629 [Mycotypha africana]KAI8966974.1 hypothetical protein BDF20DRAFT_840629 [Mycotypha africana]